jgi:TerC family integral membrane protein
MPFIWIGFIVLILALLALDLGLLNRKPHVIGVKEALGWSAFWISLGLLFSIFVYFAYENHWMGLGMPPAGADADADAAIADVMAISPDNPQGVNDGSSAALKYVTGYLIEKSLSVDNIFVIAMIFAFLAVPPMYQHRVLFWGILGALVMRGAMIAVGAQLITKFTWIVYIFGGFLILTALKMFFLNTDHTDPGNNVIVRLTRRLFPVTEKFHGQHFFVRAGSDASHEAATPGATVEADTAVDRAPAGKWMITPLLVALLMVEFTDLIFAVDSIPAIFAITTDPFLVFTSNVFAILGLRSLYFALAGMIDKFRYLKVALAFVLLLVGVKMMTHVWLKALLGEYFNLYLLAAVVLILSTGVVASLWSNRRDRLREVRLATSA